MPEKIEYGNTLASKVTERLREDILSHKIEAGSHITIKNIAEIYGVSPMPVREAFRILEGENLLEISPYKGATVAKLDVRLAVDTYQIVCSLETLITLNAIEKITDEACEKLHRVNQQMMKLVGQDDDQRRSYTELNRQFHAVIGEFNENLRARDLFIQQQSIINAMRTAYVHSSRRILRSTEEHEKIIEALRTRNRALLREVSEQHSNTAMEDFVRQFEASE